MRRAIACVATILALAACGSHPDGGQVVGRTHKAESQWTQMVCAGFNKYGACSVWVPVVQTVPECWELTLTDGEDKWSVCVDQRDYDAHGIHSTWREVKS